ncbi:MAG: 3-deoxy-manno-octulosonate cytidylyltransferase [Planctomycetaceae bacterium]
MKTTAVITARMGSSRFPGKPLAPLHGRPMIEHVYKRTKICADLDDVVVATCDMEIFDAVEAFGGKAVMTADTHERASDRMAEAAQSLEGDVFVLVQGDEPMTFPDMISEAVAPFEIDSSVCCVNLTKRISHIGEFKSPNTIKVIIGADGNALYMSRSEIPTLTNNNFTDINAFKQVCIIPFRRDTLEMYEALPPTPGEIAESIDMLRLIEHGIPVKMVETAFDTHAVDTQEDLDHVSALMQEDLLMTKYR